MKKSASKIHHFFTISFSPFTSSWGGVGLIPRQQVATSTTSRRWDTHLATVATCMWTTPFLIRRASYASLRSKLQGVFSGTNLRGQTEPKHSRANPCSVDFGHETPKFWFEFCCGFGGGFSSCFIQGKRPKQKIHPKICSEKYSSDFYRSLDKRRFSLFQVCRFSPFPSRKQVKDRQVMDLDVTDLVFSGHRIL